MGSPVSSLAVFKYSKPFSLNPSFQPFSPTSSIIGYVQGLYAPPLSALTPTSFILCAQSTIISSDSTEHGPDIMYGLLLNFHLSGCNEISNFLASTNVFIYSFILTPIVVPNINLKTISRNPFG